MIIHTATPAELLNQKTDGAVARPCATLVVPGSPGQTRDGSKRLANANK